MTSAGPATVDEAVGAALDAYAGLQSTAEEVEDEWTYVQDLTAVHRERLEAIAAEDAGRPLDAAVAAAIVAACEEVARIADPHRAIDWLSTFPSVVAIALGREP
jgi:acyl-CoA reductase-like NAD-dependent aldehyde dehydrogenase